jgi:hypothetical protein
MTMKNIDKNPHRYVPFMLLDIILAQWWRPVAYSEALDLLHCATHPVTHLCIAMVIKMASKVGVLFHHHFVCCCLDGCWGVP